MLPPRLPWQLYTEHVTTNTEVELVIAAGKKREFQIYSHQHQDAGLVIDGCVPYFKSKFSR